MPIKKVLVFSILFVGSISAVCLFSVLLSFKSYRQAVSKTENAGSIMREVYTSRLLADEYLLNHTERTIKQRDISHDIITHQLNSIEPLLITSEEKQLFGKLKTGVTENQSVFSDLVSLDSRAKAMPESLNEAERIRLSGLLTIDAQQSVSAAAGLVDINNQAVNLSLQHVGYLLSTMAISFFLMLAVCFWLIWKSASQLAAEKSKIQAIISGIGDGVVVIDTDFQITRWNHAASGITGWEAKEVLGLPLQDVVRLIRAYDRKPNYSFIEEALLYAKVTHMENHTLLITKYGQEVSVGDSAAPVFDDQGKVNGVVIIFRDVSAELDANRLNGEFAYASHQLRTPVGKSLSILELALKESNLSELQRKVALAHQSLLSTVKIVEQMIAVSEIDQANLIPHLQELSISDLIQVEESKLKPLLDKSGSNLKITNKKNLTKIWSDEKYVTRALFEVLHNAISYSPPKSTVNVEMQKDGPNLVITVKDSGIGIPEEDQNLIFTKFYRGSNLNATTSVGAGLGLYIAKSYLKAVHGQIWFDSTITHGSVFYLSLPTGNTINAKEEIK